MEGLKFQRRILVLKRLNNCAEEYSVWKNYDLLSLFTKTKQFLRHRRTWKKIVQSQWAVS